MKPDEQQATLSGSIPYEWQLSEQTTVVEVNTH